MMVLGRFLKASSYLIKCITFDAHHSHKFIRQALFGSFESFHQGLLSEWEFWKEVEYQELPPHNLPRLPLKICRHEGRSIVPLPGACHASKNAGGQLNSPIRTIMFGKVWCDSSGARRLGMAPAVFKRSEPMSDALHASLWNPYFVIESPVFGFEMVAKFSSVVMSC